MIRCSCGQQLTYETDICESCLPNGLPSIGAYRVKAGSADELLCRYDEYREAIQILNASYQTVATRREALKTRDAFETDLRGGMLDALFYSGRGSRLSTHR